jgi:hypothetical protein
MKFFLYSLFKYMKKLYFNLLCLLFVIFIIYCFTRKEGFLTIDASQMCVTDAAGAITCDGSTINDEGTVGQQGHLCVLPGDTTGYIINTSDSDYNMYSGAGFNPGSSFACDVSHEREDPNRAPVAIPCFAHNGPIILNGCVSKCQQDPSLPGKYGGGATLPSSISDGLTPLPGVICDSANLLPATNKCYQRDGTINTAITTETACTGDNTWFSGGELQAVCHNRSDIATGQPVEDYKIIGCEEGCLTRNSGNHKQDYITGPNEPDTGGGTAQGDNREVIYINNQKIPATQDPYDVSGETVLAAGGTFNVAATCGTVAQSDGTSVSFAAPFGPVVTEACNLDPTSDGSPHFESRRYSVSGCYPTCPADERCINMLFSYSVGTPAPELDPFKEQLLQQYIANTTTALTATEQQQFKDQIYYYRKYRHDGQDHIEAQFKCADADCQFADASIDAAITSLGGTASQIGVLAAERGMVASFIDMALGLYGDDTTMYDIQAAAGKDRTGNDAWDPFDTTAFALQKMKLIKWVVGGAGYNNCNQICETAYNGKCVDDAAWGVNSRGRMAQLLDGTAVGTNTTSQGALLDTLETSMALPAGLAADASLTEGGRLSSARERDGPPVFRRDMTSSGWIAHPMAQDTAGSVNPDICTHRYRLNPNGSGSNRDRKLCKCYVPRKDICRADSGLIASSTDIGGDRAAADCPEAGHDWVEWVEPNV